MKIRINTNKIKALNPCQNRLDNWLKHYSNFNGDIVTFLDLTDISPQDKIWVTVRLLPRFIAEVFAIDCGVSAHAAYAAITDAAAYAYAYDAAAAYADAAAYAAATAAACVAAADAADAAYAAAAAERQRQIEALIYLIQNS